MKGYVLSVERVIQAEPGVIFDVLSDASKHRAHRRLGHAPGHAGRGLRSRWPSGSTFGMGMKMVMRVLDGQPGDRVRAGPSDRLADRARTGTWGRVAGRTDLALRARAGRRRDPGGGDAGTSPPTTSGCC